MFWDTYSQGEKHYAIIPGKYFVNKDPPYTEQALSRPGSTNFILAWPVGCL